VARPAPAEVVADGEVLADVDALRVAVREAAAEPRHEHDQLEALYVLSGELAVTVGDERADAPAGAWVLVEPGVPHALEPRGGARVVAVHAPGRA
jgi:quercetin dioxygenase-like cupin family protein